MKNLCVALLLLSLTACEGSTAKGFWGPSAEKPMCSLFGDCGGTKSCELYGNCDKNEEVKSCEIYGNCGE